MTVVVAETGLDYFGARYFSGAQGRFTSPDLPMVDQNPADPQSWNLYAYGRNNPLRYTDPTGRKCVQTSNGPADDGTGGGCKGAGVDENGNITPQQVTVGVGRDEANLIMLQRVGEQLSSPHEQAEVISNGVQGAMAVEGIRSIRSLFRAGISLWKNWRTISSLYGVLDHLLFGSELVGEGDFAVLYKRSGGFDQALADFRAMVGDATVVDKGNGIKVATIDGVKITVRPGSGTALQGPATLDVIRPGAEKTVKFRY